MSDEARRSTLARVRNACNGLPGREIEARLQELGRSPVARLPDPDPATAFLCNVLKNGGSVDVARDRSDAVRIVGEFLYQRFRSHKLVAGSDPRLAALPWREAGVLPRFDRARDGDQVTLSFAVAAAAETGSVILVTGKGNPAANFLLPEIHLVLVDTADLCADLDGALARAGSNSPGRPRGIHIISGPSSTSDIALRTVQGAHGPRQWHVILMGEEHADALELARQLAGLPQSGS